MRRLVAVALVAAAMPSHVDAQAPTITGYIDEAGGQEIVVPAGIYSGGTVVAPHGDWLILKAATPGSVVVDGPLNITGSSKVVFVGFAFQNGELTVDADDIVFWHTTHRYPDYTVMTGHADIPRFIQLRDSSRVSILGADFFDGNASVITVSRSVDATIEGVRIWGVFERSGTDPNDYSHCNDITHLVGPSTNLKVRDTYLENNRTNHQTLGVMGAPAGGDINGLVYERIWYANSTVASNQFNVFTNSVGVKHKIRNGRRNDVWVWSYLGNVQHRHDVVDGVVKPAGSSGRIVIVDTNIHVNERPFGVGSVTAARAHPSNPALLWRAAHPYNTYAAHLGAN